MTFDLNGLVSAAADAAAAAARAASESLQSQGPAGIPRGDGSFSTDAAGTAPQRDLDLQLAQMSNDVYDLPDAATGATGTQSERELAAAGWHRLQAEDDHLVDAQGNTIAIDPAMLEDPDTGFRAAIYQNAQGQYVVAYAGTDPGQFADLRTDAAQAFGLDSAQYNQAVALAKKAEVAFGDGNVVVTGHSLGGGLASAAALATGATGVTFNAAGLSNETMRTLGLNPNAAREQAADSGQLRRYVVETDPLTTVQQTAKLPISPPDAVGHELRVDMPPGTTPYLGSHGGSGDGTSYVEALRLNVARDAERPAGLHGLVTSTAQIYEEGAFNAIGATVAAVDGLVHDAVAQVRDTAGDVRQTVRSEFAQGDYVEGVVGAIGDVADGALDFVGDAGARGVSLAGRQVENATDTLGQLIRNSGDTWFGGALETPANFVAGLVEGGGSLVRGAADWTGGAVQWVGDKVGDVTERVVDGVAGAAQWATDKVVDTGKGLIEGAKKVAEKLNPFNWF